MQSVEELSDLRQKCLLNIENELQVKLQLEADIAAAKTVQDVRPSPKKYARKEKQQADDLAEGGFATPPAVNRRKMKIEFKKEDQEVLQDTNPIDLVAAASGKWVRSKSPSDNSSNNKR